VLAHTPDKRFCPLGRTFGFLRVLNQGDDRRPFAIATQLTPICARLQASRARGPRRDKTKDRQREGERAKLYADRCVSCFSDLL